MSGNEFTKIVKGIISEEENIQPSAVNIVWMAKILRNNKAIAIGAAANRIYEITYNGEKDETYIDVYDKRRNYAKKNPAG